ncbi:MAG: hypothetical protein GTN62_04220 [Gemmatimonadales bacterium]|nr:hypothetical protein [Gemmatimonadales bacterium]NIN10518.1 hypothetical protein [Gemmatimonadales bacterium]NIN49305.1 hypothetical protein [Gemmatimonadales bacterium]NIP06769.1 hypothetical protein [Gemmatimonadales bacterium]NIR02795.1 hypothetical protein [Gemmatimonadales bacterium]
MQSNDLLLICFSAFAAVFLLLGAMAIVMRTLIAVLPVKAAKVDPAILAAVTTAVSATYPGTKITKVEEIK